jgi:tetratricopeptide (TPR) repeat protein
VSTLHAGQRLLHYDVAERIGAGGMGEVYRAIDSKLGRSVAIKVLPASSVGDAVARRRFLQEARSVSALNHPNIVTVHAIESESDFDCLVMEYIQGRTLAELLAAGPLPLAQMLEIGARVAEALGVAHAAGILHRDVKPANIMVTPAGQVKVLDFGLAKPIVSLLDPAPDVVTQHALTAPGMVIGTMSYMSPEQTRGEPLDAASDTFSLGCVLYEAATRKRPFDGPSALMIMNAVATVNPPPPSAINPELPPEFDVILQRALAKERQRRPSAADVAAMLRDVHARHGGLHTLIPEPIVTDAEPDTFVGRERELQRLEELLQQAEARTGKVVFLTGEPGIGKTVLTEEFMRRARRRGQPLLLARGRCVEQYGPGEAYLPFLDALGALLAGPGGARVGSVLRTHAPTWCLQLPAAFGSSGALEQLQRETIGATKDRMLRELGDALVALSPFAPVVLVLEDLHWADPPSVDLLRHLSHRLAGQRLLLMGTFRPEEVERDVKHPLRAFRLEVLAHTTGVELSLDMLTEEHLSRYLNGRFVPNDFPPEFTAMVHRRTDGHPLFAMSLIQFLVERGDIIRSGDRWTLVRPASELRLDTPEGVRSLIRKKIEALSPDDQRVLQSASVEGDEFLSTVTAGLLETDDLALEERLDRLDKVHRLVKNLGEEELPDGALAIRYRFVHALYQNVLYADLVSKRRIMLHRRAGELLRQHYRTQASRVAMPMAVHFERGRDFAAAIDCLIEAGDNAMKLYANTEAEGHYSRALSLLDRLSRQEAGDRAMLLHQKRGSVCLALSRFDGAIADFTAMLALAKAAAAPEQESIALNSLSQALFFSHRIEEMGERTNEAIDAAERAGSGPRRSETMALMGLKRLCYGELAEAKPLLDDTIRLARSIDHRPAMAAALAWRGALHYWQSEYEQADRLLVEAHDLAEEIRDSFVVLFALFIAALTRGNQGRISAALDTLQEAIHIARRNGDLFWYPRLPNCIGWLHRELQDLEGAVKFDQEGLEIGRQHGVLEAQANSLINLGCDYTQSGASHRVAPAFREVEDIFARDAWFRWRYNIRLQAGTAALSLKEGRLDDARADAARLQAIAEQYGAGKYVAVAHNLMAAAARRAGDTTQAIAHLTAAVERLRANPAPLIAWKTHAALGRLLADSGDPSGAQTAFAESERIIRMIASETRDERLRSIFLTSRAVSVVFEHA